MCFGVLRSCLQIGKARAASNVVVAVVHCGVDKSERKHNTVHLPDILVHLTTFQLSPMVASFGSWRKTKNILGKVMGMSLSVPDRDRGNGREK